MNHSAVFLLLFALALLSACNSKNDNNDDQGWTKERRQWIYSELCQGDSEQCKCVEKEVSTTVTYKEFVRRDGTGMDMGVIIAAHNVCGFPMHQ